MSNFSHLGVNNATYRQGVEICQLLFTGEVLIYAEWRIKDGCSTKHARPLQVTEGNWTSAASYYVGTSALWSNRYSIVDEIAEMGLSGKLEALRKLAYFVGVNCLFISG